MKLLYVGRLFSGLESSVVGGTWRPTGAPTVHRVIEALDRTADMRLILTEKDNSVIWSETSDRSLRLEGLRAPVLVLAGSGKTHGRVSGLAREVRQAWRILVETVRWRPDVIYVDHANAMAAGVLARLRIAPVVFRVMGVYPVMRQALTSRRLALRALRWAYRAPFALVICSEDGSGSASWLAHALRPGVRRELKLNGVDPLLPAIRNEVGQGATTVLFVGKLEKEKGCDWFIEGFLKALQRAPGELRAVVVGTGKRAQALKAMVSRHQADELVTFHDRVPHARILDIHRQADIYVSLNRLGNFSNANLEAMRVGACMILPAYLPDVGAEDPTGRLLPPDSHARIAEPGAVDELADTLLALHRDPCLRRQMSEKMKSVAEHLLPTWQERVEWEVDTLFTLVGKSPPLRHPQTRA